MSLPSSSSGLSFTNQNIMELESLHEECQSATEGFRSELDEESQIQPRSLDDPGKTTRRKEKKMPKTAITPYSKPQTRHSKALESSQIALQSNPLTSTQVQTEDITIRYKDYISNPEFKLISPWVALDKYNELSKEENEDIKNFGKEYYSTIRSWSTEHTASQIRAFLDVLPLGIQSARLTLNGIFIGIGIEHQRKQQKLVEELSGAIETSGIMMSKLHQESRAHQQQTIEFINQISNASETVSKLQSAVEQMKLETLRMQTLPSRKSTEEPTQPPQRQETPMSISPIPFIGTPVEKISSPGTYTNAFGIVKIDSSSITSIIIIIIV